MKKKDVIAYFGSETATAKALGIARQSVNAWGDDVPELSAWQIEDYTDGDLVVYPGRRKEKLLTDREAINKINGILRRIRRET